MQNIKNLLISIELQTSLLEAKWSFLCVVCNFLRARVLIGAAEPYTETIAQKTFKSI